MWQLHNESYRFHRGWELRRFREEFGFLLDVFQADRFGQFLLLKSERSVNPQGLKVLVYFEHKTDSIDRSRFFLNLQFLLPRDLKILLLSHSYRLADPMHYVRQFPSESPTKTDLIAARFLEAARFARESFFLDRNFLRLLAP